MTSAIHDIKLLRFLEWDVRAQRAHRRNPKLLSQRLSNTDSGDDNTSRGSFILEKTPGEYAEDIYDGAHAGNWKLASAESTQLADSSSKLRSDLPSAREIGEIQSRVSALEKDIAKKDRLAAMTDANEITRPAAEVTDEFRSTLPVQVVKLDYLERKLQIESAQGSLSSLKQTTSEIRSNCNGVKAALEQKHSVTANSFEAS